MDPLEHYRYLIDARDKLMDGVRLLSPAQYEQEFPFGLKTVRRTLHHLAGAEWLVIGQLREWPREESPFSPRRLPDAASLEAAWRALQPRTVEIISSEQDWNRTVEITVIIPSRQAYRVTTTAANVFTQFCYHEIHHRSQVMAMLRQLGAPIETLDFLLLTAHGLSKVSVEEALKGRRGG